MTRLSSTHSVPRTSLGKSGSILSHRLSDNQNRLDFMPAFLPNRAQENQQLVDFSTRLMGFGPSSDTNDLSWCHLQVD